MASGDTLAVFTPYSNEPPAAAYATLDTRNAHPCLDFDGTTDEEAVFTGYLPANFTTGAGLTVSTFWAFSSATSGNLRVQAGIERIDLEPGHRRRLLRSLSERWWDRAPGTSGHVIKVDVVFTSGAQMDSLVANELFRLKIRRDADGTSGTDDIASDAELVSVVVKET